MQTVLLVPGFEENLQNRNYRSLLNAIEEKGYKTKFIPITWKQKTLTDWVSELEKEYAKHKPQDTILAGFSYGAMTAFVVASKRPPAELWLFSLSSYFSEDLAKTKLVWLHQIIKRRNGVFWRTSFDQLYPNINCQVKIFLGTKEAKKYPSMKHRFEDAGAKLAKCKSIVVPGVGHEIDNPTYVATIKANI